jgi:phosphoserine phosphatase
MQMSKYLAMSETSLACSSFLLEKIAKGTAHAAVFDVRGGLISAAGILEAAPTMHETRENQAFNKKFKKAARAVGTLDKALEKLKKITPETAAAFRPKVDRVLKQVGELWPEVRDSVCRGKD